MKTEARTASRSLPEDDEPPHDPWSALRTSGAGWSSTGDHAEGEAAESQAAAFPERYRWCDVLGVGGLGTVHIVHDQQLGREVAYKRLRIAVPQPQRARLLSWEAWVTARLEHPAVVPIYDAGYAEDGHAYYTMRLVRGRSFSAAADEDGVELPGLLRVLARVCRGVAFAHSQGIVHRDLKPANVMVGAFGEVQIVDWGLAGLLEPVSGAEPPKLRSVGTRGYAAPEQLAGAPPSARADVHALGVMIGELPGADAVPAIRAIVARATEFDPSLRYANASELADELERFLDGRAVEAYEDSPREALARWARRRRVPILLTLVAAIAGVAGLGASYRGVLAERARAVRAESAAREAERAVREELERTDQALVLALEGQAVRAQRLGALAEAEVLAAEALRRRDSVRARGVLANVYAHPRASSVRTSLAQTCERVVQGPGAYLCFGPEEVALWRGDTLAWRVPFEASMGAFGRDHVVLHGTDYVSVRSWQTGEEVERFRAEYEPRHLLVSPNGLRVGASFHTHVYFLDEAGDVRSFRPCPGEPLHAMGLGDRFVGAACSPGRLRVHDTMTGASNVMELPFGRDALPAFSMAFSPDDRQIAVGNVGGLLAIIDRRSGAIESLTSVASRPIGQLAFVDAHRVIVLPDGGVPTVVDTRTPEVLLRLPRRAGHDYYTDDSELTTFDGSRAWRWSLPDAFRPGLHRVEAGLAGASFDPGGRYVALARGDGVLSLRSITSGEVLADVAISSAVIKGVVAEESQVVAAVADEAGLAIVDGDGWSRVRRDAVVGPVRRVARFASGVVALGYGDRLAALRGERFEHWTVPRSLDLANRDGHALLLDRGGRLWVQPLEVGRGRIGAGEASFARLVATSAERTALAYRDGFEVRDPAGHWRRRLDEPVDALVFAPDGEWLALGLRDGVVQLWSMATRQEVARIEGAEDRISWLGVAPDGRLASASWDGTLRFYDLGALRITGEAAQARARATYGLDADDILTTE
ncbi:MAG: WD40 repeat domain-containing serine/threonine-protein kinase [Myxococcota bacterium]